MKSLLSASYNILSSEFVNSTNYLPKQIIKPSVSSENEKTLIEFPQGEITINNNSICIERNVIIRGSKNTKGEPDTILMLPPKAQYPIIQVGNEKQEGHIDDTLGNILIENLVLIGNYDSVPEIKSNDEWWIKNNCIDIRNCKNIIIKNCVCRNSSSGGIVGAFVKNLNIIDCVIEHSVFDGVAIYTVSDLNVINSVIRYNKYSGISVDALPHELCKNITVINSIFEENEHFGIWIRNGEDLNAKNILSVNTFKNNGKGEYKHEMINDNLSNFKL